MAESESGRPPLGWKRAANVAKFLGIALLGLGIVCVGLAFNANYDGNSLATSNDLTLTFVLSGFGVNVLGLGYLLATFDRP